MIFNDKEEVAKFLDAFEAKYSCYLNLVKEQTEKQALVSTDIQVNKKRIIFFWIFKTREDYKIFFDLLAKTKFLSLLKALGWKTVYIGSR